MGINPYSYQPAIDGAPSYVAVGNRLSFDYFVHATDDTDILIGAGGKQTFFVNGGGDIFKGGDDEDLIDLALNGSAANLTLTALEQSPSVEFGTFQFASGGNVNQAVGIEKIALSQYSDTVNITALSFGWN